MYGFSGIVQVKVEAEGERHHYAWENDVAETEHAAAAGTGEDEFYGGVEGGCYCYHERCVEDHYDVVDE